MADLTSAATGKPNYVKIIGIGLGSLVGLGVLVWIYQKMTTPATVVTPTPTTTCNATCMCATNQWQRGLPVITAAAQNIINALMNHGGNVSNASSLQSQWNQAANDANAMANVLSGATGELKAQFMNKKPRLSSQNTFNAAYNNGMNSAVNIEGMVTSNNTALITSNTNEMINVFVNP